MVELAKSVAYIALVVYHPRFAMADGRLKTPAPTMAVTL